MCSKCYYGPALKELLDLKSVKRCLQISTGKFPQHDQPMTSSAFLSMLNSSSLHNQNMIIVTRSYILLFTIDCSRTEIATGEEKKGEEDTLNEAQYYI